MPGELLGGDPEPFSLPWCDELDPPAVAMFKGHLAVLDAPLDPFAVNGCSRGYVRKDAGTSSFSGSCGSVPATAASGVTGAAVGRLGDGVGSWAKHDGGEGIRGTGPHPNKGLCSTEYLLQGVVLGCSVVKKHRVLNTAAEIAEDLVTRDRARKRLLNKRELHPCAENLLCVENRRG